MYEKFKDPEKCVHEHKSDFSYYEKWTDNMKTRHFYCLDCGAHWLKGDYYTKQEWFDKFQSDEAWKED